MATLEVTRSRVAWVQDVYRRTRSLKLPWIPVFIVTILLVCAAFAPLLAPHDPTLISMLDAKIAPGEDTKYPLGTDIMGRDMLSRLIYGARTSVFISLVALGTGCSHDSRGSAQHKRNGLCYLRQNCRGFHAGNHLAPCLSQYRQHPDGHNQSSGGAGHSVGGVPKLFGLGPAGGRARLGYYGVRREVGHLGCLVVVSLARFGYHRGGTGLQLLWRLDAGRLRPKITEDLNPIERINPQAP